MSTNSGVYLENNVTDKHIVGTLSNAVVYTVKHTLP